MEEKRIAIFVVDGNVKVASKLRDVVLDIVGFDNLGEYVEPALQGYCIKNRREYDSKRSNGRIRLNFLI